MSTMSFPPPRSMVTQSCAQVRRPAPAHRCRCPESMLDARAGAACRSWHLQGNPSPDPMSTRPCWRRFQPDSSWRCRCRRAMSISVAAARNGVVYHRWQLRCRCNAVLAVAGWLRRPRRIDVNRHRYRCWTSPCSSVAVAVKDVFVVTVAVARGFEVGLVGQT